MKSVAPLGDNATAPMGMLPVEEARGSESVRGVQVQVLPAWVRSAVLVFQRPPVAEAR